jgi:hypothetical protein
VVSIGTAANRVAAARAVQREVSAARAEQRGLQAEVVQLAQDTATIELHAQGADGDVAQLLAAIKGSGPQVGDLPDNAVGLAFVIDTSGSMRDPATGRLWGVVGQLVRAAIDADAEATHVIAFDADGRLLSPRWLPRTAANVDALLQALSAYNQDTISNPAPGLYRALGSGNAGAQKVRVHVWVIGDEFVEREAQVWSRVEALNPADASGHRRATISAIQLPTTVRMTPTLPAGEGRMANTGLKFQMLMSELAKTHGGTYRLLPQEELK